MVNMTIDLGRGLVLRNPVMTASGTFGYGEEYTDFVDLAQLGGIIVKGTTLNPREGNPYPRMAETASGMLNCVGLQNKGVQYFIDTIYPRIKDFDTNVLLNLSGSCLDDYVKGAEMVDALDKIPAIELNVSCPNVKQGGMAFGVTTAEAQAEIVCHYRWFVRGLCETGSVAHGVAGGQSSEDSRSGIGRHLQCHRCRGVHARRCLGHRNRDG